MDLFEAFPRLQTEPAGALQGRALRLISISALAFDETAYYFELAQKRYWARSAQGLTIGVSGAHLRADTPHTPLQALRRYLRDAWDTRIQFFPGGPLYVLEAEHLDVLTGGDGAQPDIPHILILTPPQLGGADVPDALAQAVYFLGLRRKPSPVGIPGILQVERAALGTFLEEAPWSLAQLRDQPWATLLTQENLPPATVLRPVLALRGLRQLWEEGLFSLDKQLV